MPENTVKVDRSTHLGNPFIVGVHGNIDECIKMFKTLLTGYICYSVDKECIDRQRRFLQYLQLHKYELWGKNLACWCKLSQVCHADVLLKFLNRKIKSNEILHIKSLEKNLKLRNYND